MQCHKHLVSSVNKIKKENKKFDLGRIRTCNLLIRSQTRYPLRHETL
jgi:hypothetical protein